ncbi:predicted protein [Pyrenophora tritici-repentis Pt-1C-BFP]|uniref:Uncharacterized protein n=1 Tax=Pyrenophora tritici-repentis (strain Pt-1C-BFP) TaxID=426418 RepID=B2W048_PYRTR|nr:uncharacterized protein PTRG_03038 [Pyrenophora tritici-repentis Pt-1C-BFP]EDU45561.1 predicted protein [Pyrenophora tritici-repentis Pt-1C-BFP]
MSSISHLPPTVMDVAGNAGMQTNRIIVINFTNKKKEFTLNLVIGAWLDSLPSDMESTSSVHDQRADLDEELEIAESATTNANHLARPRPLYFPAEAVTRLKISIVLTEGVQGVSNYDFDINSAIDELMEDLRETIATVFNRWTEPQASYFPAEAVAEYDYPTVPMAYAGAGEAEEVAVPGNGITSAMEDMRELDPAFWSHPAAPINDVRESPEAEVRGYQVVPMGEASAEGIHEYVLDNSVLVEYIHEHGLDRFFQNYPAFMEDDEVDVDWGYLAGIRGMPYKVINDRLSQCDTYTANSLTGNENFNYEDREGSRFLGYY